jgi:phosphoribosylanthranilate isomerase
MHVKICGITSVDDARLAADAGADFIGMILADSPRRITRADAQRIAAALPTSTQPVLVVRDQSIDEVAAAVPAVGVRWMQLHGSEPPGFVRELLATLPDLQVIRAWEVSDAADAKALRDYVAECARFDRGRLRTILLDTPKGRPGPDAATFRRWAEACTDLGVQIWRAGGLTPENLAAAVGDSRFSGVDVAAGVEIAPGRKEPAAVRRFIATARRLGGGGFA